MKERLLLELLVREYSPCEHLGWIPAEKCALIMVSYNQRFQHWRINGIVIKNRIVDGKSEYKLCTHPHEIDRENKRSTVSQLDMNF